MPSDWLTTMAAAKRAEREEKERLERIETLDANASMHAEIARLRAALEVIAAMSEPIATSSWDELCQGLEAVGARARRALDGKEADGE